MQHGTTWHTYCAVSPAGNVGLGKCCASCDQTVDIWCVDTFISKATNGVEALIVREYHENVWFSHVLVPTCRCGPNGFS